MNSWHSFSPNSRWLVFSSKVNTPYTQMFLTHIDPDGNDSPAVLIPNSTAANRAVNLPEFVNVPYDALLRIDVPALAYYRHALRGARLRTQGKFNEALAELDAAVKLRPDFQHAHVEAAVALTKQGRRDEALARLNKALSLDPKNSRAHGHAGIVLAQSGKLDEARARFETALRLDPYYRTAHANLGRIFLEQGKLEPATEHFRTSMELDETDPQGHFELGQVLFRRQMLTEAVEQFRRTLAIDPKHTDSHLLLSKALAMQGDFPAAVAQLRKATATDPNNVRPVADLAWLLAVCPHDDVRDGVKAVELAQRACAVTGYKSPVLLNTLAAAYAEIGDFSKAIATATKALSLVEPQDAAQAQWIAQNLEHFRAGKPCRAGAVAPSP
jgi:tetratricopeptide (TPR) repeat protein